jgi:hypothetical protein
VEFKLGKRRKWANDDAQLCAQGLCLEEVFGVVVPRGGVFHADSKRRRQVEFTSELRRLTENAVAELRALLRQPEAPESAIVIPPLPAANPKHPSKPQPLRGRATTLRYQPLPSAL